MRYELATTSHISYLISHISSHSNTISRLVDSHNTSASSVDVYAARIIIEARASASGTASVAMWTAPPIGASSGGTYAITGVSAGTGNVRGSNDITSREISASTTMRSQKGDTKADSSDIKLIPNVIATTTA